MSEFPRVLKFHAGGVRVRDTQRPTLIGGEQILSAVTRLDISYYFS